VFDLFFGILIVDVNDWTHVLGMGDEICGSYLNLFE